MKELILDYNLLEIKDIIQNAGFPKYRANQLYKGLIQGMKFSEITTLPKDLIEYLNDNYLDSGVVIYKRLISKIDGTEKYLFKLSDDNIVEGVLMRYKHGNTICISTQVGCRMGCKFCASGLDGLIRDLTPGEILGQVLEVNKLHLANAHKDNRSITNIVLMGSGEPLDNYDNVIKFLHLVNSEESLNISRRNISLSTSGLVDKIRKLANEDFNLTLTISLHASNDSVRKKIMPVANKYNINELIDVAKYYYDKTGRRVIFEYALIANFNDSINDAKELSKLLNGFASHVNLIVLNKVKENNLEASSNAKKFLKALEEENISCTIRRTLGADIDGACGQLRRRHLGDK